MVLYNYVVDSVVVEEQIPYPTVLIRTGLKDQVGLADQGYVEYFPPLAAVVHTAEQVARGIRLRRQGLLSESDWTVMPDSPLTTAKKNQWKTYRQALRDLPANNAELADPREVVLPTVPE